MSTTNTRHNPTEIAAPAHNFYAHAVEIPANSRQLYLAGQVGVRPDGTISSDFADQVEQTMKNIEVILTAAGMGFGDIVRFNAYCMTAENIITYAQIRNAIIGAEPPASTAIVINGLANSDWKIEIDLVAARAD